MKYYHATSTIFLDSIKENGLGKINPTIDYKNLEVLKYLKDIAEKYLINDLRYLKLRQTTLAMINQKIIDYQLENGDWQKLNYRHDGIYVAASLDRAAIYAMQNKYGSEILGRIIEVIKLLRNNNIEFFIPQEINLFGVEKYLHINSEPIIIVINEIQDDNLEDEFGNSALETLKLLRQEIPKMSVKKKHEDLQYKNFKIINSIEAKELKFYSFEYEGSPLTKYFEYTLTEIYSA